MSYLSFYPCKQDIKHKKTLKWETLIYKISGFTQCKITYFLAEISCQKLGKKNKQILFKWHPTALGWKIKIDLKKNTQKNTNTKRAKVKKVRKPLFVHVFPLYFTHFLIRLWCNYLNWYAKKRSGASALKFGESWLIRIYIFRDK